MLWRRQEQQCSVTEPVGAVAASSDKIDVCVWPRGGYREPTSAELIMIHLKN